MLTPFNPRLWSLQGKAAKSNTDLVQLQLGCKHKPQIALKLQPRRKPKHLSSTCYDYYFYYDDTARDLRDAEAIHWNRMASETVLVEGFARQGKHRRSQTLQDPSFAGLLVST